MIRPSIVGLVALVHAITLVAHGQTPPNSCTGSLNSFDPFITQGSMQQVASVPNGLMFTAGPLDNQITVVHLYGSAYEMGLAHGQLLREQITYVLTSFLPWVDTQLPPFFASLPRIVQDAIADAGVEAGLELEALMTELWTPDHFLEEMQGVADGSGYSFKQIRSFNMFTELIKASCTMVGAWGTATGASSSYGEQTGLLGVRLLDWDVECPMRTTPTLFVYHPSQGNTFASLSWPGFVGTITGYGNETSICEKVWIKSNETALEGRFGYPWAFMLRDILQFDRSIEQAHERMQLARRTASIWIGVGSHASGQFEAFGSSYDELLAFNATTPFPGYAPQPQAHPTIPDVVYINKHTQPSTDSCLADVLLANYGSLSAQVVEAQVAAFSQSGNLQAAVYNFDLNFMDIAVASQMPDANPVLNAYERQYLRFNMTELFAQPGPQ